MSNVNVGDKHEAKVSGKLTVVQVEAIKVSYRIGRTIGFREEASLTVRNLASGRQLRDVPPSRLGRKLAV